MTSAEIPIDLYPELAAAGSLAAALELAAAALEIDLGRVAPAGTDPRWSAKVDSHSPEREPMGVGLGTVERWFLVNAWSRGVRLVSGSTRDLHDVVRAAAAWRRGAPLREIQDATSFVEVSEMAFAHERGPAEAVDLRWRHLLERAARVSPQQLLPLVQAAFAEPKLRQLFPYTSHWTLLFSTCTGFPYSRDVAVVPLEDNRYQVVAADRSAVLGEVDNAAAAVALVVGALPADIGPAVAGTAEGR